MVYRNKLHIPELVHDAFRKIWIHQTWPITQPYRLKGYVVQGMRLTLIYVCLEVYIIGYHAVKIHSERFCRLIPSELAECTSMGHIPSVGINIWPIIYAWEVLENPCLKWYIWIIKNGVAQVLWKWYINNKGWKYITANSVQLAVICLVFHIQFSSNLEYM